MFILFFILKFFNTAIQRFDCFLHLIEESKFQHVISFCNFNFLIYLYKNLLLLGMNVKILKFIMILFAICSFHSCKDDDIDMSKIDFSNIENLYEQPLPVIQKCVEGKWKWYVTYGGFMEISYSDNTFVTINKDNFIVEDYNGSQLVWHFTWEKCSVDRGYKTWVMWNKERNESGWYFHSIKNDTLRVLSDVPHGSADIPSSFDFVRIK